MHFSSHINRISSMEEPIVDSGCPIGQSRRVGYRKIHVLPDLGPQGPSVV